MESNAAASFASLAAQNRVLGKRSALERIAWALERLPGEHVLSSSFGAQAAVCLHLATRVRPDIPVVLIDTGYLFPETYRYVDTLVAALDLNLEVYRPDVSPAWQEARHGQRWHQGVDGIAAYNAENKVEPMRRALDELGAGTWIAGLRRAQSRSRAGTDYLAHTDGRYKLHPIADWSDADVQDYLERHGLPRHPLREKGYLSIGDTHTTRPIDAAGALEATRFFGLTRECGLHEIGE